MFRFQLKSEVPEERRLQLEECGRKYWKIYVHWTEVEKNKKHEAVVKELKSYLAMKSMKDLNFNI